MAFPFPSLIDWGAVVLDADPSHPELLLEALLAISPHEIRTRQRYLRQIAPLLLVDVMPSNGATVNGATAFLHELKLRVAAAGAAR